jgi:hypothetical protein
MVPFIQVGTNETAAGSSKLPESYVYYAFWSDKAHHFQPIPLFSVTPLTEVAAALTLSDGRWAVSIRDLDSGEQARFTTSQEGRQAFGLALWLQEDPGSPARPDPYPTLQNARLRGISVNGSQPAYADLHSQWMTVNRTSLGPSALIDDSFEVAPESISRDGARYLHAADRADRSTEVFEGESAKWTARTPRLQMTRESAVLAAALTRFVKEMEGSVWPKPAARFIRTLTKRNKAALLELRELPARSARQIARWREEWISNGEALGAAGQQARRVLGVPQIQVNT